MPRKIPGVFLAALIMVFVPGLCRYTVRDVGFVDLDEPRWKLGFFVDETVPVAFRDLSRATAGAVFLHANVDFNLVDLKEQADRTAFEDMPAGSPLPAAALFSPDGRHLKLQIPRDRASFEQGGFDALASLVKSPTRVEVADRIVESHAVVVLALGPHDEENERVRGIVSAALEESGPLLEGLPKPARKPSVVIEIPWDRRSEEHVLLWGLGVEPHMKDECLVGVLYGRLRMMGPLRTGSAVTRSDLREAMLMIGQDCECELDRRVMRGRLLPFSWDEGRTRQALRILDFDTENPMVKAEISRILARGAGGQDLGRPTPSLDGSVIGYEEQVIDEEEDRAPAAKRPEPVETPGSSTAPGAMPGGVWWSLGIVLGVVLLGTLSTLLGSRNS